MNIQRLERTLAVTTFPNFSVWHVLAIKIRIFLEWVVKRCLVIGFRRRALKPLRILGKLGQSNDALVIGNGPSAQSLDWSAVVNAQQNGMAVFAINYFPLSQEFKLIQPNYLVLSDPTMKPNTDNNSRTEELWNVVANTPTMDLIVPLSWYRIMKAQNRFSNKICYFDDSGLEGWTRNISPLRARGYLALTAYKAIAVSIYLGFKETKIIGIDNSMFQTISVDIGNRLIQQPNHFFSQGGETSDMTAFYPKGISDYFYDVSLCFYFLSHCFAGQSVSNLDPNSLVDAFPKHSSSDLINKTNE
jgi:hypothetical protein